MAPTLTRDEFIAQLRKEGQVPFEGSAVVVASDRSAHQQYTTRLASMLKDLLPADETIAYGLQMRDSLRHVAERDTCEGELEWVLVLRRGVVRINADASPDPTSTGSAEFRLRAYFFPRVASADIEVGGREGSRSRAAVEFVAGPPLVVDLKEESAQRQVTPTALRRFIAAVMTTVESAAPGSAPPSGGPSVKIRSAPAAGSH